MKISFAFHAIFKLCNASHKNGKSISTPFYECNISLFFPIFWNWNHKKNLLFFLYTLNAHTVTLRSKIGEMEWNLMYHTFFLLATHSSWLTIRVLYKRYIVLVHLKSVVFFNHNHLPATLILCLSILLLHFLLDCFQLWFGYDIHCSYIDEHNLLARNFCFQSIVFAFFYGLETMHYDR